MKYTLLIWSRIPDSTDLFVIPNEEAEKHLDLLRLANNKFTNQSADNDGLRFLNAALCDPSHIDDSYFDDGYTNQRGTNGEMVRVKTHAAPPREWRCIYNKYMLPAGSVIDYEEDVSITRVIVSGFYL